MYNNKSLYDFIRYVMISNIVDHNISNYNCDMLWSIAVLTLTCYDPFAILENKKIILFTTLSNPTLNVIPKYDIIILQKSMTKPGLVVKGGGFVAGCVQWWS